VKGATEVAEAIALGRDSRTRLPPA
jgi:hypothetical protein